MDMGKEQELSIEIDENGNVGDSDRRKHNRTSCNTNENHSRTKSTEKDNYGLKELCNLLISSFCGILDDLGLETREDEELLLVAIESGDTDTVRDYVKLLRNKLSSVLLLKNVCNKEINYIEYTPMNSNSGINEGLLDKNENLTKQKTQITSSVSPEGYFPSNYDLNGDLIECDSYVHNSDVRLRAGFDDSSSDDHNQFGIKTGNNHKKSQVPPLKVEFAGPGSWNRCQIPNEYPTD
ncbi:hypothetical protein FG386_003438 [Cryptosporidium ryanae]|uniref:uncharacterized protein n=1 Tax=Cryptosporidium ryanae TaxID=515981 RepID=UPI00351A0455|nr:hypothetical protein FG386_003438 [Cryptosporidium ryanae]